MAFERTTASLGNLGDSSKGLANNVAEAFKKTFSAGKESGTLWGGRLGGVADRIGSATTRVASWPVKLVSGTFSRFPKLATIGTVAGGVMLVGGVMNKRAERRAQDQVNEFEMAQAQSQAQAYTVTPEEYAAMQARMRQGGQNGGFAAGIEANRAAAASAMGGPAT